MKYILLRGVIMLSVFIVLACSDSVQQLKKASATLLPESSILAMLADTLLMEGDELYAKCALSEFYAARHNNLMWFKKNELTQQGDSLLNIITRATYYGLIPDDYHFQPLRSLKKYIDSHKTDTKAIARFDLLLSDAFIAMANHLRYGRIDQSRMTWRGTNMEIDSTLLLVINHSTNRNNLTEGLHSLEPDNSFYKLLKKDLRNKLDSLSLGLSDSLLTAKLNARVRDLSINMEQWRWEAPAKEASYVLVNIPSFQLGIVENDSVVFESTVVVGTPYTQTPTLDSRLVNLVLYPYWNVPRGIATRELLPKIKRDSSYLQTHQYKVLDISGNVVNPDSINWNAHNTNNFPFMLQQAEGEHNALGIVKFNFASDYNIYLHDTNAKRFFNYRKRAYSHGCVRVERALDLAKFLVMKENPYSSVSELEELLKTGKQRQVNFNPIDLRIRYYTCHPGEDGKVYFFDDVYGKNASIADAIYCRK